MPRIAGHMSAPPMPMSARHARSHTTPGAAPPSAENPAKIAAPATNARRRPKVSARRPPVTMSTPNVSA
jgi:hypothetical protein